MTTLGSLGLLCLAAQAGAADAAFTLKDGAQLGTVGIVLGVLVFVVRVLREVTKDAADRQATTAKENADRVAMQERECAARNEKTVSQVDAICDRFADTQIAVTEKFSETVLRLHEQRNKAG